MATESASRPLRVLALHGYLQTGQILRERTGPLRRALKKRVEFIFLDGPYPAFSNEEHLKRDDGKRIEGKGDDVVEGRGWWKYEKDPVPEAGEAASTSAPGEAGSTSVPDEASTSRPMFTCVGWEDSVALVRRAALEHAPVDGLVGFSQGSALAALCLADAKSDPWPEGSSPRFAILIASFLPTDVRQRAALTARGGGSPALECPTLHVYGLQDAITPPPTARDLVGCAHAPRVYEHPGGHAVPNFKATSGDKAAIGGFVDEILALRDRGWDTWPPVGRWGDEEEDGGSRVAPQAQPARAPSARERARRATGAASSAAASAPASMSASTSASTLASAATSVSMPDGMSSIASAEDLDLSKASVEDAGVPVGTGGGDDTEPVVVSA